MPFLPNPGLIAPALSPLVVAAQTIDIDIQLPKEGLKAGKAQVTVRVSPDLGVAPTARLAMPSMAMMTIAPPTVTATGTPGEYRVAMSLPHAGTYRLAVRVTLPGKPFVEKSVPFDVKGTDDMAGMDMQGMEGMPMDMASMQGILGNWSMAREGSGTSWLPDDSPMFMKMLPKAGRFSLMYMGNFSLNYTDSNVSNGRGPHEFYSNSMPMLMARRGLANGDTVGFRVMGSLDPIFNGQYGAPNLFQTGETAHGNELVDRQHPHDLIAEVSGTYTKKLGNDRAFLYLAPIGEPALAGSMYLMRPSGMENPEAPITHHWFDSSHITFGVVTAGYEIGSRFKIDGSVFNGKEPDENRYSPDNLRLDSATGRLTYNPAKSLSLSLSYASLHRPERQNPDEGENRTTAALSYGKNVGGDDFFAATVLWGRDAHLGHTSDAYLAEASLYRKDWSYYLRYENVDKDELEGVADGSYKINKLTLGATKDFAHGGGFDLGVGGYAGVYSFPSSLDSTYGKFPVSLGVYLRLRPSRMKMGGMRM